MAGMGNARCSITLHTVHGLVTTDTEHLLQAGVAVDTDLSDAEVVMGFVTGRLQQFGHIAFIDADGAVQAVLTHAIDEITVERDHGPSGTSLQ